MPKQGSQRVGRKVRRADDEEKTFRQIIQKAAERVRPWVVERVARAVVTSARRRRKTGQKRK